MARKNIDTQKPRTFSVLVIKIWKWEIALTNYIFRNIFSQKGINLYMKTIKSYIK